MFWVDAQRRHAQVVQGVAGWDRTHQQLVAPTVREHLCPPPVDLPMEVAVAVATNGSCPEPASIRSRHLRPEALVLIAGRRSLHGVHYTTGYTEYLGRQLIEHLEAVA